MAKIETLNKIVSTLNYEGHYFLAAQLEEEIKRRKENYSKQKEKRQILSYYFNQEILRVIRRSQKFLSVEEIVQLLKENGITKNPVTGKPITPRMISIRCENMNYSSTLKTSVEEREKTILKATTVYSC